MADTEILPGIITEPSEEEESIPVPFQAKTELDENCVTQHNHREKKAKPYSSASPNLPSRIHINAKLRPQEILPPAKATDAWKTARPAPNEAPGNTKDPQIVHADYSSGGKTKKQKHVIKGEMLVPPSKDEQQVPHPTSNAVEKPKPYGYQPSRPNEKSRRRPPTNYAAKCMPSVDSSKTPSFEESVLYSQLYMPHTVDAHGGPERSHGDEVQTAASAGKTRTLTPTGGEQTANTTQNEAAERTTLREVWAKMFGPGSYSSLPKMMGQRRNTQSTPSDFPQPHHSDHTSHSCDELDTHRDNPSDASSHGEWYRHGGVHSHASQTMTNHLASSSSISSQSMAQKEPMSFYGNSQSETIRGNRDRSLSVPVEAYTTGHSNVVEMSHSNVEMSHSNVEMSHSNVEMSHSNSRMNHSNMENRHKPEGDKVHINHINKLDTHGKYTILAPFEANMFNSRVLNAHAHQHIGHENINDNQTSANQRLGHEKTQIASTSHIGMASENGGAANIGVTSLTSKPETDVEILRKGSTPDILLHNASISNSSFSSTTPSAKSVSSSNTPQKPVGETPIITNNFSPRDDRMETRNNDTSNCNSTDDTLECDPSSYSRESSPARKLKTKRRSSSDGTTNPANNSFSDRRYKSPDRQTSAPTGGDKTEYHDRQDFTREVKGRSAPHRKISDRDTSDSVSVNSSVVGIKRERLSSRGRNGSFAATKYDKIKSPSSQSFAGFPQHTRQYSSTSDDQSFTNNTHSSAKSFTTKHSSQASTFTDESRLRRYKLGYAKAKALKPRPTTRSQDYPQSKDLDDSLDTSEQDISLLREKVNHLEANIAQMEKVLKAANVSRERLNETLSSSDSGSKLYTGTKKYRKTNNHNKEIEHVKRRFQRLESHVVTLARSLAQLSSEMKSHHASLDELASVTQELQTVQEEHTQESQVDEKQWMTSLRSNTGSLNKLRRFFGDEPPMLMYFLENLGYESYMHLFEDECISVIELPYINERRLEHIGIPLGPRLRIIQEARLIFCV